MNAHSAPTISLLRDQVNLPSSHLTFTLQAGDRHSSSTLGFLPLWWAGGALSHFSSEQPKRLEITAISKHDTSRLLILNSAAIPPEFFTQKIAAFLEFEKHELDFPDESTVTGSRGLSYLCHPINPDRG